MKAQAVYCTMILLFIMSTAFAQNKNIILSGTILDADSKEPVTQATIQLLSLPDSTYVMGIATNTKGFFSLQPKQLGKYALKISFIGYKTQILSLSLTKAKSVQQIGPLYLEADAIVLSEAVITAEAPQVQTVEDTLVYNASAYRTPEGAVLEELVKKLPGAEVEDDGSVKINGKNVKKLMVDGKEFFGGDVATGLKNLPVEMVEQITSYEKQSELRKLTGIDDGEEETVLDIKVKKGMNKGVLGNLDGAIGTRSRNSIRGMLNLFRDKTQISVIGRSNNINDQGFSSGGGPRFNANNGLTTQRMGGVNMVSETKKVDIQSSLMYNYSNNQSQSTGYTENFLKNGTSSNYKPANRASTNLSNRFTANLRLIWKPDDKTNILFQPTFSYNSRKTTSQNETSTFKGDPYTDEYSAFSPYDYALIDSLNIKSFQDPFDAIRVNTVNSFSDSQNNTWSTSGTIQFTRKLNSTGRNFSVRGRYSMGGTDHDQYSDSRTLYNTLQNAIGEDSLLVKNQYITTPTSNYSLTGRISYSEPMGHNIFLQFSYQLQYKFSKSDRSTYDLYGTGDGTDVYSSIWSYAHDGRNLPSDYKQHIIEDQGKYAEYRNYIHEAMISTRIIRKVLRLNAGITFQPQHTRLSYKKGTYMIDTLRNVSNFAPSIDLQMRFSKQEQLRMTYRGVSNQPGMENMLPITDTSNPMNIRIGNPGLKPSFSHTMTVFYNKFIAKYQRNIVAHLNFSMTQNSVSSMREYNATTGGWTTTPENINGNWNANASFGFNTALKNKKFTIGTFTRGRFQNNVAYLTTNKVVDKNTTTDLTLSERLNGAYRNGWFEFGINGSISYTMERNQLQPSNNQNPYTFSYGASTQFTLPWNMTFTTNIRNQARRGYDESSMNRNELIWNAQLSQSFLRGNLSLVAEWNDILHQQSNISRSLSSSGRSVYQYNGINSYGMFHLIYRFKTFKGKQPASWRGKGGQVRGQQEHRQNKQVPTASRGKKG